jgi:type IV pilus assembly protein PilV
MLRTISRGSQPGFTLLEVLVSVVILGLGLLGLAGLMASSTKNSHSAYLRSEATILTYSILDAMRADLCAVKPAGVVGARVGSYDIAMASAPQTSPTEPAKIQQKRWLDEVAARLPSGDAEIHRASSCTLGAAPVSVAACDGATVPVAIVIQWDDSRGVGGGTTQQFCTVTQL